MYIAERMTVAVILSFIYGEDRFFLDIPAPYYYNYLVKTLTKTVGAGTKSKRAELVGVGMSSL